LDKRQHPRVPVKPPGKARFRLGGQVCAAVPIANIGMNGCCIHAPAALAERLMTCPQLQEWQLVGPNLPTKLIKARVVWIGPGGGPEGAGMKTGVQFQDTPAGYTSLILRYVAMRSSSLAAGAP